MARIYKSRKQKSRLSLAVVFGFAATAGLFLALPLTQLIRIVRLAGERIETVNFSIDPPPPPPEEPPPPKEEKKKRAKPEFSRKPPSLTLVQLEIALNPGDGGVSGDFGFGTFDARINALEEIDIFELAELDKKPKPRNRIAPSYPFEMKQAGISGWVRIIFIVDEKGKVRSPRVESSSHKEFEKPSIDAVLQWKFFPGVKNGNAVKTRMRLPLRFNLKSKRSQFR